MGLASSAGFNFAAHDKLGNANNAAMSIKLDLVQILKPFNIARVPSLRPAFSIMVAKSPHTDGLKGAPDMAGSAL